MSTYLRLVVFAVAAITQIDSHRNALTKGSCDTDWGSSATALQIADPTISWSFSHYFDCSKRAVWMKFTNPAANSIFYVGSGIPTMPRFAGLRVDAMLIGPGLPALVDTSMVPSEVMNDPVMKPGGTNKPGGMIFRSPADQSTCAHLGKTMTDSSTVRNGRCDFYEPYGATNSWRVLDADNTSIPTSGGTYYVAVWFQQPMSGKLGIAMGTWVENFRAPMTIHTPTCTRDLSGFSEKAGSMTTSFPASSCTAGGGRMGSGKTTTTCALGAKCGCTGCPACTAAAYKVMMGCGGEHCPAAAKLWDTANMLMHKGMALKFSGNVKLDFVRGMIPHHQGAVDMCKILVEQLSCEKYENVGGLDGLIHFCAHVRLEQTREVATMRTWLQQNSFSETSASCGAEMKHGCGETAAASSKEFIKANTDMHGGMGVRFSCDHSVDFTRSMIPHHAGAIAMCNILAKHTSADPDANLNMLCANITRIQRTEIAWMSEWLSKRSHHRTAPCITCTNNETPAQPEMPCENFLPSSSFCKEFGGDSNCRCDEATKTHACGMATWIESFGLLNVSAECKRHCGGCPTTRPPLFHTSTCPNGMVKDEGGGSGGGSGMHMDHGTTTNGTSDTVQASGTVDRSCSGSKLFLLMSAALFIRLIV